MEEVPKAEMSTRLSIVICEMVFRVEVLIELFRSRRD